MRALCHVVGQVGDPDSDVRNLDGDISHVDGDVLNYSGKVRSKPGRRKLNGEGPIFCSHFPLWLSCAHQSAGGPSALVRLTSSVSTLVRNASGVVISWAGAGAARRAFVA